MSERDSEANRFSARAARYARVGANVGGVAARLANEIDDTVWAEIGREEAAIRADPQSTNDPVLIGALGVGSRL